MPLVYTLIYQYRRETVVYLYGGCLAIPLEQIKILTVLTLFLYNPLNRGLLAITCKAYET